ncbi:hypothetical protein ELQ92_02355 [Labedella populi]|uniref:Uncharacterized protein n=1 Tax=Labedella populi TaxID=2498850 RepID=A0A3S3ZZ53_9MICO|nr:hypothetical protein [Labedella populi]RWZ68105.1 hypothetical protein ELQ92_02355 [Labedella populi]
MKVAAFAGLTAAGLALVVAAVILLDGAGQPAGALALASILALWAVGLFSAVVLLGDWWDPRAAVGRSDRRRFFSAVAFIGVLAALLLAVQFASDGVPPAVVSGLLVAAFSYVALAVAVGRIVRRRADLREFQEPADAPAMWLRDLTRHRAGNVALWFAIVLIAGVAVTVLVDQVLLMEAGSVFLSVSIAVSLASLVATIACATVGMNLYGPVRDLLGSDRQRNRRIRRAVLGRRPVELSEEERELAVAYAPFAAEVTAWNSAQNVFLITAILAQNLLRIADPVALVVSLALVLVIAITLPLSLREVARARRFTAESAAR